MNILVIGGGGREHALAWKISQSPHCSELYIAPGNPGTSAIGKNLDLGVNDTPAIIDAIVKYQILMVVVGPEVPLVDGLTNAIKAHPGTADVMVIGPGKEGARLEGSKGFAKKFMEHYHIPTADYRKFTTDQKDEALGYIEQMSTPIVLKADGLAAGKGVIISQDKKEAAKELEAMLSGKFGSASERVVIEEFLSGREFSVFILTNGRQYKLLPIAKDYKRIGEGDQGLNTGGMGAVSPVSFVDIELMQKVTERIIEPTLKGIQGGNMDYIGFIFFGLIEVDGNPYVIEYNCRLGDPETQVVLPRLKSDLVELMAAAAQGELDRTELELDPRICTTVVSVSGGYPESYDKGHLIRGIESVEHAAVFHAGTKLEEGKLLTNGGRVIACTGLGNTLEEALERSYTATKQISFDKQYYRSDIGFDLV